MIAGQTDTSTGPKRNSVQAFAECEATSVL